MSRSVLETIIGGLVLLVAGGFLIFAFNATQVTTTGGSSLWATFDNASGVSVGTDVRVAGLKVGSVTGQRVDTETFMARVDLSIIPGINLPQDSSARIVPDGLLGNIYIEIEPGGAVETLKPGERIQFTQGSVNVVDMLGRFIFSLSDAAAEGAQ